MESGAEVYHRQKVIGMLIDLHHELSPRRFEGVIQVGAHLGQEHETFVKLGCKNFVYIEPQQAIFNQLAGKFVGQSNVRCVQCAVGTRSGTAQMHQETANGGQSSSLLKPQLHLSQYPHITFKPGETVQVCTLDDIQMAGPDVQYDLLSVDVQGYELEVFKSGIRTLAGIRAILCEVNRAAVYENCPMVHDIDNFLATQGFFRAKTAWDGGTWGDGLYLRSDFANCPVLRNMSR